MTVEGQIEMAEASEAQTFETPTEQVNDVELSVSNENEFHDLSPIEREVSHSETNAPLEPNQFLKNMQDFSTEPAQVSPFQYILYVSGIDSKESRLELDGILSQAKLARSSAELMIEIQSGSLTIKELNPAEAMVLVSRLLRSSLKVKWEQKYL